MQINCTICSDLFIPAAEVYITRCGHLFHYPCLENWIKRNPSCPQCRSVVTLSKIHKVYFNLSSDDSFSDVGSLVHKVESLEFQQTLNQKEINNYKEKARKLKKSNVALIKEVGELERRERVHESAMHALKEQITFFKSKSKETDRLTEEIVKLKGVVKNTENVRIALEGSREQAYDLIRNENDIESLAILSASLKKALLDAEQKKRDMDYNLKRVQNDLSKYKKLYNDLSSEFAELKRQHQHLKASFKLEKEYLKNRLNESSRKDDIITIDSMIDSSIEYVGSGNCISTSSSPRSGTPDTRTSHNIASETHSIVDVVDSPYLTVKSNPLMTDYGPHLNIKWQGKPTSPKKGFSIFKSQPKIDNLKPSKPFMSGEICYNGLGGSSKEDIYPTGSSPQSTQTGIKRHKSSTLTSNKLRKLAPLSEKKK